MPDKLGFNVEEHQEFNDGMKAKLEGGKLVWVNKDEWIDVDDLPLEFIASIMDLPFYASAHIVQGYLDELDEPVNDGWN